VQASNESPSPEEVPHVWHKICEERAAECLKILDGARAEIAGFETGTPAMAASGEARRKLLSEKRALGAVMEELRATMRSVQEQCEQCTVETRNTAAMEASAQTLTLAVSDDLRKVRGQLQRAAQQVAEHLEAQGRLGQELSQCAEAFHGIVAQELEAHAAVEHEVLQLQQVVRDLECRLRSKSGEIDRLVRAKTTAAAEVRSLKQCWQRERNLCMKSFSEGPLATCSALLRSIRGDAGSGEGGAGPPPPRQPVLEPTRLPKPSDGPSSLPSLLRPSAPTSKMKEQGKCGEAAATSNTSAAGQHADIQALRMAVGKREEQLAALRRKIRYLSEQKKEPESVPHQ